MVRLVQVMFRYGTAQEEIAWETMVFLPKGKGEYRGIRLVEVLWKVCSVVADFCLKRSIVMLGALHGFREGRGTGMATLEAILAQKMVELAHEPIL